jgi:hypothetical protein
MSYRYLLILLGSILIALSVIERGWSLSLLWVGGDFLVLGIAHAKGAAGIFGKRSDGSIPFWSWLVFLPLLLYTNVIWHVARLLSREAAHDTITDNLIVGRRLLPGELDGSFTNYVDLTAEFSEPRTIRQSIGYECFPILDGAAPQIEDLNRALDRLRPGRTFIHCAQGHGRTGLFALAFLLKQGTARSVDEGLKMLRASRPGINLNKTQRKCIDIFAAQL